MTNRQAIYNRNWLSYQLLKAAFLIWRIVFSKDDQRRIAKNVSEEINTKNGYHAESHFLRVVAVAELYASVLTNLITGFVIIMVVAITGEEYISVNYTFYIGCIPLSLMFIHTWKSVNLEIIKARKIPYRKKSGYFTEVRNSDLVWPAAVTAIIIILSFAAY